MTDFYSGLEFAQNGIRLKATQSTHAHPLYYGLQYVHCGPLYLAVNDGPRYELEGPFAFLTSPESVFSYGSPPGTSRVHYHVCLCGERLEEYVRTGLFPLASQQEKPYFRIRDPETFLREMQELIFLIRNGRKHDMAVNSLERLLLLLQDQVQQKKRSFPGSRELEQLLLRIQTSPEKEWDFSAEAEKLCITYKHFMHLFRRVCGMPPKHYVLKQRIFKACTLLTMQDDPVKTVSDECGFRNACYFSRLFRKYAGVPPETYRNTQR